MGWFTAAFPLLLDLRQADEPLPALRAVKDGLHRLPRHGIGFGLLAAFHPDPLVRGARGSAPTPPSRSTSSASWAAPTTQTAFPSPPSPAARSTIQTLCARACSYPLA